MIGRPDILQFKSPYIRAVARIRNPRYIDRASRTTLVCRESKAAALVDRRAAGQ